MELDAMTFNDLRDIQKYEKEHEQLYTLDTEQVDKIRDYLLRKKKMSDKKGRREYENAVDLAEEIIDRRAYKIMRLAFLSLKTHITSDGLMDEEKETFQILRDTLRQYRNAHLNYITGEQPALALPVYGEMAPQEESHDNTESDTNTTPAETTEDTTSSPTVQQSEAPQEEEQGKEVLWGPSSQQDTTQSHQHESTEPQQQPPTEDSTEREHESENATATSQSDYITVTLQEHVPQFLGTDLQVYGPYDGGETITVPTKNAQLLIDRQVAITSQE